MTTRQGIEYRTENGRFTTDGYDFFDTIDELEAEIDWQLLWADGKAFKDADGWHEIEAAEAASEPEAERHDAGYLMELETYGDAKIHAYNAFTEAYMGTFKNYRELRAAFPAAEISNCGRTADGGFEVGVN